MKQKTQPQSDRGVRLSLGGGRSYPIRLEIVGVCRWFGSEIIGNLWREHSQVLLGLENTLELDPIDKHTNHFEKRRKERLPWEAGGYQREKTEREQARTLVKRVPNPWQKLGKFGSMLLDEASALPFDDLLTLVLACLCLCRRGVLNPSNTLKGEGEGDGNITSRCANSHTQESAKEPAHTKNFKKHMKKG